MSHGRARDRELLDLYLPPIPGSHWDRSVKDWRGGGAWARPRPLPGSEVGEPWCLPGGEEVCRLQCACGSPSQGTALIPALVTPHLKLNHLPGLPRYSMSVAAGRVGTSVLPWKAQREVRNAAVRLPEASLISAAPAASGMDPGQPDPCLDPLINASCHVHTKITAPTAVPSLLGG